MSERDEERLRQMVALAADQGTLDQLKGEIITTQDEMRLSPSLLHKGEEIFFPIFTSLEEMGESRDSHTNVFQPFLDILQVAQANNQVAGLVINPLTQAFMIPRELFDPVRRLGEGKEEREEQDNQEE